MQKLSKNASAAVVAAIVTGGTDGLHVEYGGHAATIQRPLKAKVTLNYWSLRFLYVDAWKSDKTFGVLLVTGFLPFIVPAMLLLGYRYEVQWNKEEFKLTRRDSWALKRYLKKKWKEQKAIEKEKLKGIESKQELELLRSMGYDVTNKDKS